MNITEELALLRKAERALGGIGDSITPEDFETLEQVIDAYANTILLLVESETVNHEVGDLSAAAGNH